MDTSGLIDESLLMRFAAEIAAVLVQTEPLLSLIVCDADVHQVCDYSMSVLNPCEKENICAPALAFVFAWRRIGAIGGYEKQR